MKTKTNARTIPEVARKLEPGLNKNHFVLPFGAMENDEVADHAIEALEDWMKANFDAAEVPKIRTQIYARMIPAGTKIDTMEFEELRGMVIARMKAIAVEIAEAAEDSADTWAVTSRRMTLLDAARNALDLSLKLTISAKTNENP
jgi:hypothetical protein|tara:strand:+ start:348 stop:782 length:435 start_codon:yes stop_codon:yes gene_type:complete